MAQEIERKFLVKDDAWKGLGGERTRIVQAYIASGEKAQLRVRIRDDAMAVLTVKSRDPGMVRAEFEYPIPIADARAMLALRSGSLIEKTRTVLCHADVQWEVDVFEGKLQGLVIAEVELDDAAGNVELPPWVGREVTDDPRYYNAALAMSGTVPAKQEEADCDA